MRRQYPYLNDSYSLSENLQNTYERIETLTKLDEAINQKHYVRMTLMTFQEQPIKQIEGEITSGSLTKDGTSNIRRSCSLQCSVDTQSYTVEDTNMDFSISKKIFLETGVRNTTGEYPEYPILWFPQGVFFISSFSISASAGGALNISISLKDKMCGLTGEFGGTFSATTQLDEMDTTDKKGDTISQKVKIYDLIQELVHHWGGEDLNNIVIEDVPLRIKRVLQWNGSEPLFLNPMRDTTGMSSDIWYEATTDKPKDWQGSEAITKKVFLSVEEFNEYWKTKYRLNDKTLITEYEKEQEKVQTEANKEIAEIDEEIVTLNLKKYHFQYKTLDYVICKVFGLNAGSAYKIKEGTKYLEIISPFPVVNGNPENFLYKKIIDENNSENQKRLLDIWDNIEIKSNGKTIGLHNYSEVRQNLYKIYMAVLNKELKTIKDIAQNISTNICLSTITTDGDEERVKTVCFNYLLPMMKNHTHIGQFGDGRTIYIPNSLKEWRDTSLAGKIEKFYKDHKEDLINDIKTYFLACIAELDEKFKKNKKAEFSCESFVKNLIQQYNNYVMQIKDREDKIAEIRNSAQRRIALLSKKIENILEVIIDEQTNAVMVTEGDKTSPAEINIWEISNKTIQITAGTDAGYVYEDFYYNKELTMNAGQSVANALDAIKNYLGNYEYFYDEFGIFHFREIKNYLNTTQGKTVLTDMSKKDYLIETTIPKNAYTFYDNVNLTNVSVNPQYENIKNDFIVIGERKSSNKSQAYQVMYHLAIDKKPEAGSEYSYLLIYKSAIDGLIRAAFPIEIDSLPAVGSSEYIYKQGNNFYYWGWKTTQEKDAEGNIQYNKELKYWDVDVIKYYDGSDNKNIYTTEDWRTELYLQGLLAKRLGTKAWQSYSKLLEQGIYSTEVLGNNTWIGNLFKKMHAQIADPNNYFEELDAFWPQIYNLETQSFIGFETSHTLYTSSLTNGNYYLDFIDPNESGLGEYAISSIGRRTNVTTDKDINCLFEPNIPDIIYINIDAEDYEERRDECMANNQPFTQVRGDIYNALVTGGYKVSAYNQIRCDLVQHTSYQKSLSLTTLPILYLEPNTRITINDKTTNTYGDFMIMSITLPLGSSNMTISCSECAETI